MGGNVMSVDHLLEHVQKRPETGVVVVEEEGRGEENKVTKLKQDLME